MPAPAMTTIFFFLRRATSRRSNWSSSWPSRSARSRYAVVRGVRGGLVEEESNLRFLDGGAPSVLTRISHATSSSFMGDALPDWADRLGEG